MQFVADLHIHSSYARACSPALNLPNIDAWSRVKGVQIAATGDFTHPTWFAELEKQLIPSNHEGFYIIRPEIKASFAPPVPLPETPTLFVFGAEISCIYSHLGSVRRVHNLIFAPSMDAAREINKAMTARGCKLASDGRPIVGMSSVDLLRLIKSVDERCELIPAHAWTPWFAVFGSFSGYKSLEECFGNDTEKIFAIETGLSSDPAMNWRVKELDRVAMVSFSDAHSLPNLAREATMFSGEEKNISYVAMMNAIKNGSPEKLLARSVVASVPTKQSEIAAADRLAIKLVGTLEFIPDEGKYHYDGHRACKVCWHPSETLKHKGVCNVCKKNVTVGVLSRVETLANAPVGRKPAVYPAYWSLVELDKIVADACGIKSRASKRVQEMHWEIIRAAGSELNVLLRDPIEKVATYTNAKIAQGILRMRKGDVKIIHPGYDGEYGIVELFSGEEKITQKKLFS